MDFYVEMALSILFAVLKQKGVVAKYERALFKLYFALGAVLSMNAEGQVPAPSLQLKLDPKVDDEK